jgi:integrase
MPEHPTSLTKILALTPGRYYYGHGLGLIVPKTKRKPVPRWFYRYTSPITKEPNESGIGSVFGWPYLNARDEAYRLHGLVEKGIDPVKAKEQEKAKGITYAEACDAFIKHRAPYRWRNTKNAKNLLGQAKGLDAIPVGAITSPMLKEALMPVWEKHPYQVIRALPMIAAMFRYAKFEKWYTAENPAAWKGNMEHIFGALPPRDNHYASLEFKDLPDFIQRLRLRQVRGTAAVALEFKILTVARSEEVLGARWSEIENRIWTLVPERTKQKREHRVPLSQRCMDILALQQEYRTGEFVFPGYNKTQMNESVLRELLRSMGVPVTPHGFRRTFRNWAFATRQDRDLAELSLGHTITNKTEGAYLTVDGLEERRPLMEGWALFCSAPG